jgi:hypothetical protein
MWEGRKEGRKEAVVAFMSYYPGIRTEDGEKAQKTREIGRAHV